MLRALFVEYPGDPGSWLVDNQYLFGSDMLVAPLMEEVNSRDVYLPPGMWIDYQTGKHYESGWHHIGAGEIPVVVLVREGSVIPHIDLAQSTSFMDWSELELRVFTTDADEAKVKICLPSENVLKELRLIKQAGGYVISDDPFGNKVDFNITRQ
jgi:alpha-D-xyloside xylohydrolase